MRLLLDAFWRAAAYCLHWRVILLSLAPVLLCGGLAFGLGWFYWDAAIEAVQLRLEGWDLVTSALAWLDSIGAGAFRAVVAPLVIVVLALPVIVVLTLLLVAALMTPAMVRLVGARRFPTLERRHGASVLGGFAWSLWLTLIALVLLVASLPLWFVPPLVLVLPPLIWGWLTYRVMSYDALAEHASAEERRALIARHRWPMLGMGVVAGYLAAAPSLLWTVSATLLVFAPVLIVLSIWLYTLVFAFSALWFAHFGLAALERLRREREGPPRPADGAGHRYEPAREQIEPSLHPASAPLPPAFPPAPPPIILPDASGRQP